LYAGTEYDSVSFRSIPYGGLNAKKDTSRTGWIPKGSVLKLTGRIDHWFQVQLSPSQFGWVYDEALTPATSGESGIGKDGSPAVLLTGVDSARGDDGTIILNFKFDMPVPYVLNSSDSPAGVAVTFFGVDCAGVAETMKTTCGSTGGWCSCSEGARTLAAWAPPPAEIAGFDGSFDGSSFKLTLRNSASNPIKRIVIDPGHGAPKPTKGFADGTRNSAGVLEKDAVMAISKKLKEYLVSLGYEVFLTRDGNSADMMDLYNRIEYSDGINADMFVSVHANGDTNPGMRGLEVYWYEPQSRALAESIARKTAAATGGEPGGVFFASFAVIRQTRVPAVLVETGYMTNPAEGKMYSDPVFIDRTAAGLADGISDYIRKLSGR